MMRMNLSILAAAAALCCCAAEGPAEPPATITVASYNIRSFRGMDGKRDIDRTIAAIERLHCDICGLQEVRKTDEDAVAPIDITGARLGMKPFFAQTLARPGFIYGIGLLSKLPFEIVEVVKLRVPEGQEPRSAIFAKVTLPNGSFYLVNTHLGANNDDGRKMQMEHILETIREKGYTPVLLIGDMNSHFGSKTMKLLHEDWMIFGDATLTAPAETPKWRFDYIAGYPKDAFRGANYRVIDDPTSSDHRPVVMELQLLRPAR